MKRLIYVVTATIAVAGLGLADTVTGTNFQFTAFPTNFAANVPANVYNPPSNTTPNAQGNPFWNDISSDATGPQSGAGFYLSGSGNFVGQNNYMSGSSNYGSNTGDANNAPNSFSFVREASLIDVSVLYTSAGQNYGANGTSIGLYDLNDPTNRITLFGNGTLWNGGAGNGVFNANFSSTPTMNSVSTAFASGNYGIWARTCADSVAGTNCHYFYSDISLGNNANGLGQGGQNDNGISNYEALNAHAHFALFQAGSNAGTFYVAFEDSFNRNNTEAGGDYNDVIFRINTSGVDGPSVPEPATLSIVGIGLLGLGFVRKLRK